ncbi:MULTISPECIES: Rieske (2Fe-2S) protein [Salinibaculum]|uniref:Rieske (2Fe-2S) protein n=1 Tax=Salinibaculum TaxID=2732368 RepID=UPI0030D4DDFF
MASADTVPVADLADLREVGRLVVSPADHSIALFHHEGEVYAVDNRCPHMGFPLSDGTVEDGILTCHWHHARFELACGDTFDIFADDVQTYPTEVEDGTVYVDPDPPRDVAPETHWRNRLVDGMAENLSLVTAKAVINLDDLGEGFATPLSTALDFGTTYRASGWGRGLTTLGTMANLYDHLAHDEKRRAMYVGVSEVADNCAGEPPRFDQYALANEEVTKERLKSWFRENCDVRDSDGAERTLRTAVAALPPEDVVEILLAAATDHLYLNASHTLDFVNKACETLDHVGWEKVPDVLASTVEQFTDAARAEERSEWRQPVDVAALVFDAHDSLNDLVAAGEGETWARPDGFVDTLLGDDPETIMDAVEGGIRDGASAEQLTDAVARAATRRVAHFGTSNEFRDWNTVHHTFTYANAGHELARRTDAIEAYRPALDGAMSVYLDRFLNQPAAPIPDPDGSDRSPERIRTELLDSFDEQGRVDEAGALVAEHFAAGGDSPDLIQTLGKVLLREDPQFHTLQNVEAAVRRFERADSEAARRLPLIATARYMAAHFPTRRASEQTFSIASRLHRGEAIHEDD